MKHARRKAGSFYFSPVMNTINKFSKEISTEHNLNYIFNTLVRYTNFHETMTTRPAERNQGARAKMPPCMTLTL